MVGGQEGRPQERIGARMKARETKRPLRALCAAALAALALVGPGALPSSRAAPSQAEVEATQDRLHELEADFQTVVEEYNLVIGGGRMVEAPYTGSQVRVAPLRTSDFVGAGRV